MKRACAFDVLENHKHIDISAESGVMIFISNIWRKGYQEDAFSEIEKLISHNNIPIIITNKGDERFNDFVMHIENEKGVMEFKPITIIKLPKIGQQFSFSLNVLIIRAVYRGTIIL